MMNNTIEKLIYFSTDELKEFLYSFYGLYIEYNAYDIYQVLKNILFNKGEYHMAQELKNSWDDLNWHYMEEEIIIRSI